MDVGRYQDIGLGFDLLAHIVFVDLHWWSLLVLSGRDLNAYLQVPSNLVRLFGSG